MTDTTAKIRAKGLESTGVTEQVANEMFGRVGSHYMAIVDLKVVDRHGPNVEGKRGVDLIIDKIEPATDANLAEHLRELTRTVYFNRQVATNGPTLDASGEEPSVDDVLAAGAKHRPHPYLASTLSIDDNAICDVCGQVESASVHADRAQLADPFAVTEADLDEADEEDTDDDEETVDDSEADETEEEYVDEGEWDNADELEAQPVT